MNEDTTKQTITVEITEKQADLLAKADEAVKLATGNRSLIFGAIMAGHDVPDGYRLAAINGRTLTLSEG